MALWDGIVNFFSRGKQRPAEVAIELPDELSFQDFTGDNFRNVDPTLLNGRTIKGTCFSQELPGNSRNKVKIFPENMTGVTFVDCNLDNVEIPAGNTVIGGTNKTFKVQSDGHDWEIEEGTGRPLSPISPKLLVRLGEDTDPSKFNGVWS